MATEKKPLHVKSELELLNDSLEDKSFVESYEALAKKASVIRNAILCIDESGEPEICQNHAILAINALSNTEQHLMIAVGYFREALRKRLEG